MVLAALGIAALLTLALLSIPIAIVGVLKRETEWLGRLRVYWLFGLVRIRLRPTSLRRRRTMPRGGRLRSSRSAKQRAHRDKFVRLCRSPGFLRRLLRLFRDLMRAAQPCRVRVRLVIGMTDPAATGYIAALLAPLRPLLKSSKSGEPSTVSIDISPDFSGPRLQGYSCASLRFTPVRMLGLCLGFALSPTVIRTVWKLAPRREDKS